MSDMGKDALLSIAPGLKNTEKAILFYGFSR